MGACIRKRVVYDMSCKRFQFFVNVEALSTGHTDLSLYVFSQCFLVNKNAFRYIVLFGNCMDPNSFSALAFLIAAYLVC